MQHQGVRSMTGLAQNQDNVSEWIDMSTYRLISMRWHYKNLTRLVCLVQSGHHYHLIETLYSRKHCSFGIEEPLAHS